MNHEARPEDTIPPRPDLLDEAVLTYLSRPVEIAIPPDFAARVARQTRRRERVPARVIAGWGPRLLLLSGALLVTLLFVLAPGTAPAWNNVRFDVELALLAELGLLGLLAGQLLLHD